MSSINRNLINHQPNLSVRITRSQTLNERNSNNINCLYCNQIGHDVIGCCDDRLLNFRIQCIEAKRMFNRYNRENAPYHFRDWLFEKYAEDRELIKAYAMKKINCIKNYTNVYSVIIDIMLYEYPNDNLFPTQNTNRSTIRYINTNRNNSTESDVINLSMVFDASELFEEINNYNNSKLKITTVVENLNTVNNDDLNECDCPICYEKQYKKHFVKLDCLHEFCNGCIINTMKTKSELNCALCRKKTERLICYTKEVKSKFT